MSSATFKSEAPVSVSSTKHVIFVHAPSVPLFWTQTGYGLKPPPTLSSERTHSQNTDAMRRHFAKTIPRYGPHVSGDMRSIWEKIITYGESR